MSNQLVSIVIPTYNCERYIKNAVDSVLSQTYSPIEIIVLDDGSTDHTAHILSQYGDLIIWDRHSNIGQAATLNKGWKMAHGTVLSYLSADDILLPNAVEQAICHLEDDAKIVLTYCDYYLINPEGELFRKVITRDFNYYDLAVKLNCQPGPGVFFRRDAFDKIGGWNIELRQMPDLDYWLRLGLIGDFKRIPQINAYYRIHNLSQTFAHILEHDRALEPVRIVQNYFQSNKVIPPTIMQNRKKSIANAYLLSARLFIRSQKYKHGLAMLCRSIAISPLNLLSVSACRLMFNAFLSRPLYRLVMRINTRTRT